MKKEIENIVRHAERSEKSIERYLVAQVHALGWITRKYAGEPGYPDRDIFTKNGITAHAELKSTGKKLRKLQEYIIVECLRKRGHLVYVIDSKKGVDEMLEELKRADELSMKGPKKIDL